LKVTLVWNLDWFFQPNVKSILPATTKHLHLD